MSFTQIPSGVVPPQVRQLIQACEPSQTAQPSPANRASAPDAPMQMDSTDLPLHSGEGAASRAGNGHSSSTAEASCAGLVAGKLAVRGHARLVARALWHAMRLHVVPPNSGADKRTDNARDASGSASINPAAAIWGAPASLGPAGAYVSAGPSDLWRFTCRAVAACTRVPAQHETIRNLQCSAL